MIQKKLKYIYPINLSDLTSNIKKKNRATTVE